MDIIKSSIYDFGNSEDNLERLSSELGSLYGVSIVFRSFAFREKACSFTIDTLQSLYSLDTFSDQYLKFFFENFGDNKSLLIPSGVIELYDFEKSKISITDFFYDDKSGISKNNMNELVLKLWEEVGSHILLPHTRVYLHDPSEDSYFYSWSVWSFCFIYLNDETNQGLVISASASD